MSGELSHRLINARLESPGLWPKTLAIFASKGWKSSRRKQAPFPFNRDINPNVICAVADRLWKELAGGLKEPLQFTHLGVAFHGIEVVAAGQQHISGFFRASTPGQVKPESKGTKRKRSNSELPPSKPNNSLPSKENGKVTSSIHTSGDANSGNWECPKCGTRIVVDLNLDVDDQYRQLTKLRMVHEDGHFAESLSASLNGSQLPSSSTSAIKSPVKATKKTHSNQSMKRKKQEGLLNFFERK